MVVSAEAVPVKSRSRRIAAMFRVEHDAADPGDDGWVPASGASDDDIWAAEQAAKKEARDAKRAKTNKSKAKRAAAAARKLEKAGLGALDVSLLLDELTVDAQTKWLSFLLTDGEEGCYFNFERTRLRRIGTERRRNSRMKDMRGWIDTKGIHLRWGERGGMDLRGTGGIVTDPRTILVTFLTRKTVETAA